MVSKGETQEEIDASTKSAEENIKNLGHELGKGDLKIKTSVKIGSPVEEILSTASKEDVSLVALSSVGEDTMHMGRIGSRTYDGANTSDRPVLVVRMKPVFTAAS